MPVLIRSVWLALILCVALLPHQRAHAHPHAWIDLRTTLVLNDAGAIIALEQEWLFDPFYSTFATEGFALDDKGQAQELNALIADNLENLKPFDYFTEVVSDGAPLPFATVSEFEAAVRQDQLWMRFVVPLETPIDPKRHVVSYAVFDPTYYIDILHDPNATIRFRGPAADRCSATIQAPTPPAESLLLAQSIDQDIQAVDTLGRYFAEQVDLSCS